ncbi:MAG: acetate--CoA ligase family protein [Candidatus Thermoplasmatota archaeon]|nr:acetate--CoA ligase family protein [Candidatus Thermoplasmatota archaeon]
MKSGVRSKDEKEAMEQHLDIDLERIEEIVQKAKDQGSSQLLESEARKILDSAGISMAEGKVVRSLEGCLEAAEEIGYPIVLKIVSEDIVHKMDIGGIALDLTDSGEVEDAYQAVQSRVKDRKPDANIKGVSVAEMIESGEEVVVGGMIDPTFGPVVMFGLGGIYVEIFEDVEFRIAPISLDESHRMITEIDSFPLLTGARGQKCKDLDALAEMISRVGALIYNIEDITDIDLNPVAALEDGPKALDVSITLKK